MEPIPGGGEKGSSSPKMLEKFLKLKDRRIKHGAFMLKRTTTDALGGAAITRAQSRRRGMMEAKSEDASSASQTLSPGKENDVRRKGRRWKRKRDNDDDDEEEEEHISPSTISNNDAADDSKNRPLNLESLNSEYKTADQQITETEGEKDERSNHRHNSSKEEESLSTTRGNDLRKIIKSVAKSVEKKGKPMMP